VDEVPPLHRDPVDPKARAIADEILTDIRADGETALLRHAIRLGDIKEGEPLVILRKDLKIFYDELPEAQRSNLERTAARIKAFAEAQVCASPPLSLWCVDVTLCS
jgi:phosphoribosyl-ATP pyrophosphohydrolase/phosphoribosyl-AMP cyclohydrolase/histidinol dehydrogenase